MLLYRHARRPAICQVETPSLLGGDERDGAEALDHPIQLLQGVVTDIDLPTPNVRVVRIKTDRPMSFSPGQYAKLRFVGGLERCYSIASVDGDDLLEFHIRVAPGDGAGSQIGGRLRVGDGLGVSGPHGSSHLRRHHEGPILCVAGGTGLAPMLSIVRGALETGSGQPVHLYYGEKTDTDVYAADRLDKLAARYPNLTIHIVIDAGSSDACRRKGPVTEALAEDWIAGSDLTQVRVYVGGSPPMACAVRDLLLDKGLSCDRIHSDSLPEMSAAAAA